MKVLLNFIFVIFANTFQLIDTCIRYNDRPFYVSGRIEADQKVEIYNAINEYNRFSYFYPALLETNNKEKSHIRIQYSVGDLMGGLTMSAVTNAGGYFELAKSVISFSAKLKGNTLQCVVLHELLHSQMLYHNDIPNSLMNYSVKVNQMGDIIEEAEPCKLNDDDISGLIYKRK
jgi:hypothetical protein